MTGMARALVVPVPGTCFAFVNHIFWCVLTGLSLEAMVGGVVGRLAD